MRVRRGRVDRRRRPPWACDDRLHQGQAEPGAAATPRVRAAVAAGEALEGVLGQPGREARGRRRATESTRPPRSSARDGDRRARRGVPARVVEQVGHHLVEPLLVAGRLTGSSGRSSCHRWSGPTTRASATASSSSRVRSTSARARAAGPRRGGRAAAGPRPGRTSGPPRPRPWPGPRTSGAGSAGGTTGQLGVAVDGGQRRPQLVGGVGDELPHLLLAAVPGRRAACSTCASIVFSAEPTWPTSVSLVGELVGHPDRRCRSRRWTAAARSPRARWPRPRAAAAAGGGPGSDRRRPRPARRRPARAAATTISRLRIVAWMSEVGRPTTQRSPARRCRPSRGSPRRGRSTLCASPSGGHLGQLAPCLRRQRPRRHLPR